jgi:hypothetical protein
MLKFYFVSITDTNIKNQKVKVIIKVMITSPYSEVDINAVVNKASPAIINNTNKFCFIILYFNSIQRLNPIATSLALQLTGSAVSQTSSNTN